MIKRAKGVPECSLGRSVAFLEGLRSSRREPAVTAAVSTLKGSHVTAGELNPTWT